MKKCLWLLFMLAVLITGCSSPEEHLTRAADALPSQIEDSRKYVQEAKINYENRLNDQVYTFIKQYSPEQRHANRFDDANARLDQANKAYNEKVKVTIKNYESSKKAELEGAIGEIQQYARDAKSLSDEPLQWAERVVAVKSNMADVTTDAQSAIDDLNKRYNTLQADMNAARVNFAKQATVIDRLMQPFTDRHASATAAFGYLLAEAAKQSPNYLVVTEHSGAIAKSHADFVADESTTRSRLGELPRSETHTLLDVRVDSAIEISRTSWDESDDWTTEHEYDYSEVFVDMEAANHFATFAVDTLLATDGPSGFTTVDGVDRGHWDKLHIDPRKDWPDSYDDMAEFYLGGFEDTYCHKVRVLVNGKPDLSGRPKMEENHCSQYDTPDDLNQGVYWQEGDELEAEAIGMDILSKGAGDFNDQMINEASPPGMTYVGEPQYGQWQTDTNGNSFWVFYGQYRFFSDLIGGPNPYHYAYERDEWNRSHRYNGVPYFASSGGAPRYGAKSPMVVSRFPNSTFVSSGLKDATVRNAGPVARAGGPNGGK